MSDVQRYERFLHEKNKIVLGICAIHWIDVKQIEALIHLFSVFGYSHTLYEILSTCILYTSVSVLGSSIKFKPAL